MILNKDYSELVNAVIEGETDPLEAYGELMEVKSFIDYCVKEVKDVAVSEAENFEGKQFVHKGYKFQRVDGRRMYKFDHIKTWNETHKRIKEIEALAKSAADKYNKNTQLITDDGEVVEPAIVKFTSPSLSVKRKS
jgi:serine/threonine-protein kinase RIO1